jgi:hypothetical protein
MYSLLIGGSYMGVAPMANLGFVQEYKESHFVGNKVLNDFEMILDHIDSKKITSAIVFLPDAMIIDEGKPYLNL